MPGWLAVVVVIASVLRSRRCAYGSRRDRYTLINKLTLNHWNWLLIYSKINWSLHWESPFHVTKCPSPDALTRMHGHPNWFDEISTIVYCCCVIQSNPIQLAVENAFVFGPLSNARALRSRFQFEVIPNMNWPRHIPHRRLNRKLMVENTFFWRVIVCERARLPTTNDERRWWWSNDVIYKSVGHGAWNCSSQFFTVSYRFRTENYAFVFHTNNWWLRVCAVCARCRRLIIIKLLCVPIITILWPVEESDERVAWLRLKVISSRTMREPQSTYEQ